MVDERASAAASTGRKRAYRSPIREQRAAQTREAVVEAAAEVFSGLGWTGATVARIAQRAGVSVETVHATGSKAFLLLEAFRSRYTGRGGWTAVTEDPAAREVLSITDRDEGLARLVDFVASAHAASASLWLVVRTTAMIDPVVQQGFAELMTHKRETFGVTARWVLDIGIVSWDQVAEVHLDRFVAMLNLCLSAETYLQLREDYDLSDADYRRWLADAVPATRP